MWKVTRKGLAGHKLRFLLTALAVVLGVSFIAGTLVLTATIQKTFDDLFANINRGTDAAVRSSNVIKGDFGNDQRANVPASLVAVVKQTPTVEDAVGNIQPYAQAVDNNDKAIGGNGPPTFGLGWDPNPKLNQFHLVAGHAPADRRRDRRRQADRRQRPLPGRSAGHDPDHEGAEEVRARRHRQVRHRRQPRRRVDHLVHARRGAARREREERVLPDLGGRQAGRVADPGRAGHPADAGDR